MKQIKLILLLSLLTCFMVSLDAVNLPLSVGWRSLTYSSYTPAQEDKELSWNELYQARIGILPIQIGPADFGITLITNRLFNETTIRVQDFELGYTAKNWRLAGTSSILGHGHGFQMDELAGLRRGYDAFRYQQSRLNGVKAKWRQDQWSTEVAVGGNVHNQAMLVISIDWQPGNHTLINQASFTQELRAMDSHWRSPVAISGLSLTSVPAPVQFKQTTAMAYLPDYDTTNEHIELYHQGELLAQLTPGLRAGMGFMYLNRDYSPKSQQRYQAFLEYSCGNLRFMPLSEMEATHSNPLWSHRLAGSYCFQPQNKVSLFYEYAHQASSKPVHSIGLEANLSYCF